MKQDGTKYEEEAYNNPLFIEASKKLQKQLEDEEYKHSGKLWFLFCSLPPIRIANVFQGFFNSAAFSGKVGLSFLF